MSEEVEKSVLAPCLDLFLDDNNADLLGILHLVKSHQIDTIFSLRSFNSPHMYNTIEEKKVLQH